MLLGACIDTILGTEVVGTGVVSGAGVGWAGAGVGTGAEVGAGGDVGTGSEEDDGPTSGMGSEGAWLDGAGVQPAARITKNMKNIMICFISYLRQLFGILYWHYKLSF